MEIISGLNNPSVHRLKKLWSSISPKVLQVFDQLDTLMNASHNFKNYRAELKKRKLPILPYVGNFF